MSAATLLFVGYPPMDDTTRAQIEWAAGLELGGNVIVVTRDQWWRPGDLVTPPGDRIAVYSSDTAGSPWTRIPDDWDVQYGHPWLGGELYQPGDVLDWLNLDGRDAEFFEPATIGLLRNPEQADAEPAPRPEVTAPRRSVRWLVAAAAVAVVVATGVVIGSAGLAQEHERGRVQASMSQLAPVESSEQSRVQSQLSSRAAVLAADKSSTSAAAASQLADETGPSSPRVTLVSMTSEVASPKLSAAAAAVGAAVTSAQSSRSRELAASSTGPPPSTQEPQQPTGATYLGLSGAVIGVAKGKVTVTVKVSTDGGPVTAAVHTSPGGSATAVSGASGGGSWTVTVPAASGQVIWWVSGTAGSVSGESGRGTIAVP